MVRSAVFNSSPWIFLTKLGIIEPALSLFQQVHIPLSVSNEILSKPDESAIIMKELQKKRQIDILKARNIRLVDALGGKCHNIVNTFMCHDIVDTLCFLSQIVIKFLDLGFTQKEL